MSMTITTFDETAIDVPSGVDTLNGFRRWAFSRQFPERGRISFLDGELEIDMSPEEASTHLTLKDTLLISMSNFVEQQHIGRVYGDGILLVNEEANIANEPDVTYCSLEALKSRRVEFKESKPGNRRYMELRGTPDLVVEIVSRSSARKDKKILRERYFAAGIREYWLIDAQGPSIIFEILVRSDRRFRRVIPGRDGSLLSQVFRRRVLITREPDFTGLWRYSIEWLEPRR